ncbi:MAG: hypothetical protein KGZ90_17015 [Algoriphagus sp.]|nr:hypothetical protein [Algoriphagus sp.]
MSSVQLTWTNRTHQTTAAPCHRGQFDGCGIRIDAAFASSFALSGVT